MPNHFTVIAFASRDWQRAENDDKDEVDFGPLEKENLCKLLAPMPEALGNIVSAEEPLRYRHKTTGKFWNDCNGPFGEERKDYEQVPLTDDERAKLVAEHGADNWYDWCAANWGTKWGTYELKVHHVGGDGSPVLIEFQTAWAPPNPELMRKIDEYLKQTYYLKDIFWIGFDPADGEIVAIIPAGE